MASKKADFNTTIAATRPTPESGNDAEVLLIVMSGNNVGSIYPLSPKAPLTVIGREDISDIQVLDAEISRRHAAIRFDAATSKFHIVDLKSRNGTRVNGVVPEKETPLEIGDKIELGSTTVLRVSLAGEAEAKYARKMFQAALRDGLTHVFNRRYLDDRLTSELAFAKRHEAPLALLLTDLDHFKKINDEYGHLAGDFVLERFARLLESQVRAEDVVARYGGEEFAVLCRDTDENQAAVLAERLRFSCEHEQFAFEGKTIPVTVSIGIAGTRERGTYERSELIQAADKGLYAAKEGGRNCWRIADV